MRVMLGVVLWCLLGSSVCLAQQQQDDAVASAEAPRSDVRVIFDVSGSMRRNDPDQLSASALELLVAMLPSGARGGLWTFGKRVDNPLPVAKVDRQWRDQARALAPQLVDYQQFTDIEAAIRQAGDSAGSGRRHLVLLTDGVIDLQAPVSDKATRDAASRRALLEELGPRLAEQGVVIHAIAFSQEADLALVERLAQTTDGLATLARTPDDLLRSFLDILDRIFPADRVPLRDGQFVIDPGVESFSALLFHDPESPPTTLIGPDGQRYGRDDHPETIRWQAEPRFDLITVPSPQEGEWRVEGEIDDGSRISVASELALRTAELPATLYLDFAVPLTAWLESEGEPLPEGEHPEGLKVRAELEDLEGETLAASELARDGRRFSGRLPAPTQVGNARLVIDAAGENFQRQQVQAVNVLPALDARLQDGRRRVVLEAQHPRLTADNTRPWAELQGEALEVEARGERHWRIALPALDADYRLPLLLGAKVTLDGETREIRLPSLSLNPEARIGVDAAGRDGDALDARSLPGEERGDGEPQEGLADRVVETIEALPRQAQALWRDAGPEIEQLTRRLGADPEVVRPWMLVVAVLALLLVLLILMTGRRGPSRRRHPGREEPHV